MSCITIEMLGGIGSDFWKRVCKMKAFFHGVVNCL